MQKPLLGEKIAVLVANGFSEKDLTATQRELMAAGANMRIVSMDHGLVNSWSDEGWGLNFAADQVLSEALAVDYTMLMIPGGERSIEKLKLTAHTRRFLGGFMKANKPVALFEEAVSLLAFAQTAEGKTIAGAEAKKAEVEEAGAIWSDEAVAIDQHLITGKSDTESRESFARAVFEFLKKAAEENAQALQAA
ncbi:MAG: DJ-1/PfpI family protein [Alphaproteobacteria bacterium]|nr:DJ-1/PfpI family protein [Alphaproteobacteria bacterium]